MVPKFYTQVFHIVASTVAIVTHKNIIKNVKSKHMNCLYNFLLYMAGPAKIDHVSTKNRQFLPCLL